MLETSAVSFVCRHKTEADQIEKIAKDANDTSTKAYNLLLKTLEGESRTGQEIEELNKKWVWFHYAALWSVFSFVFASFLCDFSVLPLNY